MTVHIPPAEQITFDDVMPTLRTALADDPALRWVYPDDETYERAFPELLLLASRGAFDAGTVDVVAEGAEGAEGAGVAGVAIWSPPGSDVDPEEINAQWGAHYQQHVDPARLGDIFAWGERFGHFHPTEPHWYLGMLGVAPGEQGRGHGSALLRAGLERCDRDGLPAYLESGEPRNRALYERHGFEVIGEVQIADSPSVWPMFRRPGGGR